jgi:hypothetical protein
MREIQFTKEVLFDIETAVFHTSRSPKNWSKRLGL